jgi:uncharacterized protein YutE (UPF0331/DUF86 family)
MADLPPLVPLLRRVTGELAYLQERAGEDVASRRLDEIWMSGLKYRFVTVVEAIVNVAQQVCASQGWEPSNNVDAVRLLGDHDVVPDELADRLAAAASFQESLVHDDTAVDDDRVVAGLGELDDIEAFVAEVSRWVMLQEG